MQESGENYLETILILHNKNNFVRSIDIATELNYSKPSISRAMSIYERHNLISKFLRNTLGISEELSAQDACRIEHIISQETFNEIKRYVESH